MIGRTWCRRRPVIGAAVIAAVALSACGGGDGVTVVETDEGTEIVDDVDTTPVDTTPVDATLLTPADETVDPAPMSDDEDEPATTTLPVTEPSTAPEDVAPATEPADQTVDQPADQPAVEAPTTQAPAPEPALSADEIAELEAELDAIDQLLNDVESSLDSD